MPENLSMSCGTFVVPGVAHYIHLPQDVAAEVKSTETEMVARRGRMKYSA
jgi:hypothetical protein